MLQHLCCQAQWMERGKNRLFPYMVQNRGISPRLPPLLVVRKRTELDWMNCWVHIREQMASATLICSLSTTELPTAWHEVGVYPGATPFPRHTPPPLGTSHTQYQNVFQILRSSLKSWSLRPKTTFLAFSLGGGGSRLKNLKTHLWTFILAKTKQRSSSVTKQFHLWWRDFMKTQ
jgi:hypothetical protein